jgi:hypothetical protein
VDAGIADNHVITAALPPRPRDTVIFRRLAGGGVVVNLETDQIFELNETGARIWEFIVSGETIESIPAQLAAEFDVDVTVAASETRQLLEALHQAGLLES